MQETVNTNDETQENSKTICAKNEVPSKCGVCGGQLVIGGPIWNDKLHNLDFVKKLYEKVDRSNLGTRSRIKGVLGGIIDEEWLAHRPLSFDV